MDFMFECYEQYRPCHEKLKCIPPHHRVNDENEHNLDICVLQLRQGQIQEFLGLKGRGAHESERTVFPMPQFFSMCRRRL